MTEKSAPEAAVRELSEETGYGGTLIQVGTLYANGYSSERRHVFVCQDAERHNDPHPDQGENLELVLAPLFLTSASFFAKEI